eukprot:763583-Hanusia_phi.AAC.7
MAAASTGLHCIRLPILLLSLPSVILLAILTYSHLTPPTALRSRQQGAAAAFLERLLKRVDMKSPLVEENEKMGREYAKGQQEIENIR